MPAPLLQLLGPPQLTVGDEALTLQGKPVGVLALVALSPGGRMGRGEVAAMLWPDDPPENSRHNLRQVLWSLRRLTGTQALTASRQQLALSGVVEVDVARLRAAPAEPRNQAEADGLCLALESYRGDFLAGMDFVAGVEFEDRVSSEREAARRLRREATMGLARWCLANQRAGLAVPHLEALVRDEPLNEEAVAALMSALASLGDTGGAEARYQTLARMLTRELGVDPHPELRRLAAEVRSRPPTVLSSTPGAPPAAGPASRYLAAVFAALAPGSNRYGSTAGELRYLGESLAGRYGSLYRSFVGDGLLALFEDPDAAVAFARTLCAMWQQQPSRRPPVAAGCHFGPTAPLAGTGVWVGRGTEIAKHLGRQAPAGTVVVSEALAELLDPTRFSLQALPQAGEDPWLPARNLYLLQERESPPLPLGLTAEDWFLRGVGLIGTEEENGPGEAECYRRALALKPDYPEAHNSLAVVLAALGDADGASFHYREALRLRPTYPECHYNYGLLLAARGNRTGAAHHFRAALATDPDLVDAHLALAGVLVERGESVEAELRYRRVLQLRPGFAEAHNNLAGLLEATGRDPEAEAHYRQALELRPGYAEAHYNYALLLERLQRVGEAEYHYRAALRAAPASGEAHNNLGVLLGDQGRREEAEAHLRRAMELRPSDPEPHHNLAVLLRALGRAEEAAEMRQLAVDLLPADGRFHSPLPRP